MAVRPPAFQPLVEASEKDDLSGHLHRMAIGILGIGLPILLWFFNGLRPIPGQSRWLPWDSISSYYYSGAVAFFVGILFALWVFLVTYRGYANRYGLRDRIAAIVAGFAALGVAFFPTGAPKGLFEPAWWSDWEKTAHYLSALTLFASFTFFCLVLFPSSKKGKGSLPSDKRARNNIYYLCGGMIVVCLVWAGAVGSRDGAIFWPETLALWFFGTSWLVKGRADRTALNAGKRALYYGLHPGRIPGGLRQVIRNFGR